MMGHYDAVNVYIFFVFSVAALNDIGGRDILAIGIFQVHRIFNSATISRERFEVASTHI